MFYSHTYLARNGSLATAWCAAHVQHKLRKSNYTSTNIAETVDNIMFSAVPFALRMSGHLLLGVVRIYSKKVDYLYKDCNMFLIQIGKVISAIDLPEGEIQAPAETITLPPTFALDAIDLGAEYDIDEGVDMHRRDQEEISMPGDSYITITLDEDVMTDFLNQGENPDSWIRQMDEDVVHQSPVQGSAGFQDPGLSDIMGLSHERVNEYDLPHDLPEIEMHDVIHDLHVESLPVGGNVGFQDPGPSHQMDVENLPMGSNDLHIENLPVGGNVGFQDPGPSHQMEQLNERSNEETVPQEVAEMEVMRDPVHDLQSEGPLVRPEHGNDATIELDRSLDQVLNDKENPSPNMQIILYTGEQSLPFQQPSQPPTSAVSQEPPESFHPPLSFGDLSPALAIASTPHVEQARPKRRKRQQLFDNSLVLSNKVIRRRLENSSGLLRKKRRLPCSALDVWKHNIQSRKEDIFFRPSVTGMCEDLCNISREDVISLNPQLAVTEQAFPEPPVGQSPAPIPGETFPQTAVVQSTDAMPEESRPEPRMGQSLAPTAEEAFPGTAVAQSSDAMPEESRPEPRVVQSPAPTPDVDIEIEHLRDHEGTIGSNVLPEVMTSSPHSPLSLSRFPSSSVRGDFTPRTIDDIGSELDPRVGKNFGTRSLPTPDFSMSAGTFGSDLEMPVTFMEEELGGENTNLSGIPELVNSAEVSPPLGGQNTGLSDIPELTNSAEELNFLELDNMTATGGSPRTPDARTLSSRTRGVAQYLKNHSPTNPTSEDPSGELSLNKLLEGKTRKIAARMFFETLALKSYGLIDVRQEESYGDITLIMTPELHCAQF